MINPMYFLPTIALVVAAFTGFNEAVLALFGLAGLGVVGNLLDKASK